MNGRSWRSRGLELEETDELTPKTELVRRTMWISTALLLTFGALGLFGGGGPLDRTRLQRGDVEIEYDRFVRFSRSSTIHVRVNPRLIRATEMNLTVSGDIVRHVQLENISPAPLAAQTEGDAIRYRFAVAPGRTGEITLRFSPDTLGRYRGAVAVADAAPIPFMQFSYP